MFRLIISLFALVKINYCAFERILDNDISFLKCFPASFDLFIQTNQHQNCLG